MAGEKEEEGGAHQVDERISERRRRRSGKAFDSIIGISTSAMIRITNDATKVISVLSSYKST